MDTFAFLKILAVLVMPPASLTLGALLALLLLAFRGRRPALIVLVLAVAQAGIRSFQPGGAALTRSLERRWPAAAALPPACCYAAIVVLGGGIAAAPPPELPEPDLNEGA